MNYRRVRKIQALAVDEGEHHVRWARTQGPLELSSQGMSLRASMQSCQHLDASSEKLVFNIQPTHTFKIVNLCNFSHKFCIFLCQQQKTTQKWRLRTERCLEENNLSVTPHTEQAIQAMPNTGKTQVLLVIFTPVSQTEFIHFIH